MKAFRIALAMLAVLTGCAGGPPPERASYLLRADPLRDLAPADPDALIGFGRVRLAAYLDREGIVVEVSDHEIREAHLHIWSEPLDQAVGLYLRNRVAFHLGRELDAGPGSDPNTWRYRIDVGIERLHGSLSGEVRLVARFAIRDQRERTLVASERVTKSVHQAEQGYTALVESEIELLDDLARSIADALR
jgi:uncharacterized lipoprotein YmbA